MNERQRRLKANQIQLLSIYEDLFGSKYVPGLQEQDKEEFNSIISAFRERIYDIRQAQKDRENREGKKGYHRTPQDLAINQKIRQDIVQCQQILKQALNRMKADAKSTDRKMTARVVENREGIVKNCHQMLKDVKQTEEGGHYVPPSYITLNDIKMRTVNRKEEHSEVNLQQEEAIDRFKKRDQGIDQLLQEVINIDAQIKRQLKHANQMIDDSTGKIQANTAKVDKLNVQIQQGTNELKEVLTNFRKPNKLCLDVLLVLLLLALVGIIIKMIQSPAL